MADILFTRKHHRRYRGRLLVLNNSNGHKWVDVKPIKQSNPLISLTMWSQHSKHRLCDGFQAAVWENNPVCFRMHDLVMANHGNTEFLALTH